MELNNTIFDEERLKRLEELDILDSLEEEEFNELTFLASQICDTSVALISFVDKKREWFKSKTGIDLKEAPVEVSFSAHAIQNPKEVLIVKDVRTDSRFKQNPLLEKDPNIVFYAGIPLVLDDQYSLGTLAVLDDKPRDLTEVQISALLLLSKQVVKLVKLRRYNIELQKLKAELATKNKALEQFAMVVAHDIRSPLSCILLANDVLNKEYKKGLAQETQDLITIATKSAEKIKTLVDGILLYHTETFDKDTKEKIELELFFDSVESSLDNLKKFEITYSFKEPFIFLNKVHLEQIFQNLITNSIRYNDKPIAKINISFTSDERYYYFTLKDNGIGIAKENIDNIFNLFYTERDNDQLGRKSYGIGLPTTKKIITAYNGAISISSEVGQGSVFSFSLLK